MIGKHNKPRFGKSFNAMTIPLLLLLMGMISVAFVSFQNSDKIVEQQVTEEYISILENKYASLDSTFSHMLTLIYSVLNQDDTYDVVSGKVGAYEKSLWITEARRLLCFDIQTFEGFDILFYGDNGFYFFKGNAIIKYGAGFKETTWYTEASASDSPIYWFGMRTADNLPQIKHFFGSYRLQLAENRYSYVSETITAFFSLGQTKIDNLMACTNGTVYLVNEDGKILYDTDSEHVGENVTDLGLEEEDIDKRRDFLVKNISGSSLTASNTIAIISPVNEIGLALIHVREHVSLLERFKVLQLLFYLFFLAVLIFIAYYIDIYLRIIQKPLRRIFNRIPASEPVNNYPVATGLKRLDLEFNKIMLENKVNLHKINEFERNLQLAEIKKLQAEIDPHFLYNVLSHIRFAAIMESPQQIKKIVEALFVILDSKKRQSGHFITVGKEMEILSKYIEIMQIIYKGNIEFIISVDPAIKSCLIPSFILQPIVENSIHHGINPAEKGGVIKISGRAEDESLVFEVDDNGSGIQEEALTSVLNNSKNPKEHMGIINIDKKIKLCCGEKFGVSIDSSFEKGAKVTLRVAKLLPGDDLLPAE